MWVWALAIVGSVFFIAWKRPRAPSQVTVSTTAMRLREEDVRAFVDAYDEKIKIESEIDALDARVQKGRIPRRRYKVQKKTMEIRLSTLDRTLAEIGGRMHSAGGQYSDLMRQLEVAETEIDEVETNMASIEARQTRGEISLETYRKLLGDYERRRDRAKTTINGILLRLREEIR
jgi:chromosome segregation ATPase